MTTEENDAFSFALNDLPAAQFYGRLFEGLGSLGIVTSINPQPFDLDVEHPFDTDTYHRVCDEDYVGHYHRVLAWVDQSSKSSRARGPRRTTPALFGGILARGWYGAPHLRGGPQK